MDNIIEGLEQYLEKKHPCIVCGSDSFGEFAKQDYLNAMKCNDCGMISVNPHFTEEGLDKFYNEYYGNRAKDSNLSELRKKAYIEDKNWVHNFVSGGKVLDVGCSDGSFLSYFDENIWDKHGIDLTDNALSLAKHNHNITTYKGKIWDADVGKNYDLVMMRGVVEHFRDPIIALNKCVDILKPGGILFLTATPNGNSFAFNLYKEKWRMFTPYEHIHFFTVDLLTKVLSKKNMKLLSRHFQYEETPYANPEEDFAKIVKDISIISTENSRNNVDLSPPFPESMLTAVWKKQ
jgi:2-polyprenyl-3-methyl-5-hydroxy-6-metoxy-1,4-benzoquinol methylase